MGAYVEPILAIHDELILECDLDVAKEVEASVVYEMENAVQLCVPVKSESKISKPFEDGGSWGTLK
jgi:DNA polymerase I-like protein with 3'-5' exonuclease and polymerase domains